MSNDWSPIGSTPAIKEFSSIYPIVFGVENALRSVMADYLEETFGRMDWRTLIRDARANGLDYCRSLNASDRKGN